MTRSVFGQISLWLLILCGAYYAAVAGLEPRPLERILSPAALLPSTVCQSGELFLTLQVCTFVGLLLWSCHYFVPASALIGVLSLTAVLSLSVAGQVYVRHQPHVVNSLLLFYALWVVSRARDIKAAPRFWYLGRLAQYPDWLYGISLLYLTTTYTYSGLTKLVFSGMNWPNGVSLQIWCWSSESASLVRSACLFDTRLAAILQALVLCAESTCILAYLFPRLRILYGVTLIGFHVTVELLFDFQFYGNICADLLFLVLYPRSPAEKSQIRGRDFDAEVVHGKI